MIVIYEYRVTYRRRNPKPLKFLQRRPSAFSRRGRDMALFHSKERANSFIDKVHEAKTGGYFRLEKGNFEVEENY
jgi:hypothetical protein